VGGGAPITVGPGGIKKRHSGSGSGVQKGWIKFIGKKEARNVVQRGQRQSFFSQATGTLVGTVTGHSLLNCVKLEKVGKGGNRYDPEGGK